MGTTSSLPETKLNSPESIRWNLDRLMKATYRTTCTKLGPGQWHVKVTDMYGNLVPNAVVQLWPTSEGNTVNNPVGISIVGGTKKAVWMANTVDNRTWQFLLTTGEIRFGTNNLLYVMHCIALGKQED